LMIAEILIVDESSIFFQRYTKRLAKLKNTILL